MADVDLSVAVTSQGVRQAIAEINDLREGGRSTAAAMQALSSRTATASRDLSRMASNTDGLVRNMASGRDAVNKLTDSLRAQEDEYKRLASLSVGATPAQRLANSYGSLDAGKAAAAQIAAQREAYSADPVKDYIAVQRQEQQLLDARTQKLQAQKSVSNALWEGELQKLTPVQRAQERLTRALQEQAAARSAIARANAPKNSDDPGIQAQKVQQQAAAQREFAAATREATAAQNELARATEQAADHGNAFQSSFSYFIIAGMAQQVTQSIVAMGGAAITASADIERSFADVERTFEGSASQLASLQNRLKELATQTPISVVDLAEIATLGNQLGVAAADIESFTTTIAQYTAVSGQSAEDAATAFGRISNLTGLAASQYSNLASAITYVARTTVATESSIQNTAKEITALASGAGFSADSIVGLAGALSSLAIPPERARGALSLYFGALNSAVAEGGPKLAAFAQLTGKTTDEIGRLVRENRGQEVFTSFISGLSELDTVAKTTALDTLGLSTIRVDQTMRALAQNVPLVTSSFAGANKAFTENTEIANQYAIIQETLSSKIIEFQNAIQLAAGAVGGALEPELKNLLGVITDVIVNFTSFAESPVGQAVLKLAGIITGLVLVMSTLIGAAALVKASMVVIPWALTGLGATTANKGIFQFIAGLMGLNLTTQGTTVSVGRLNQSMVGTGAASAAAGKGLVGFKAALISTGVGAAVVLIGTLIAAFESAGQAAKLTATDLSGLGEAIKADTEVYQATGESIATFSTQAAGTTAEQDKAAAASANWARVLGTDLVAGAEDATDAISRIAAGDAVVEEIRKALGAKDEISTLLSDGKFAAQWKAVGLNMTDLIAAGIQSGGDKGALQDSLDELLGGVTRTTGQNAATKKPIEIITDSQGNNITNFYNQIKSKLLPALASTAVVMQDTANKTDVLNSGMEGLDVDPLVNGFIGATESLSTFQSAVQSGLSKFSSFSDILSTLKEQAKELGDDSFINADSFLAELGAANDRAFTFFEGIKQLAQSGRTEFATQLAALGPEAQGILSSALAADPATQAAIETEARLAAFLASEAFSKAFEESMSSSNDAYALIFKTTGDLGQVQSYIAAQVAGTGAEWERQWALQNPSLPLNVDLQNPSEADLNVWKMQAEGRLVISAQVEPRFDPASMKEIEAKITYSDTVSGASIELPASLQGQALTESLNYWSANQQATPEEIASELNTDGFSGNIDAWRAANGPITVYANIVPLNSPTVTASIIPGITIGRADGGIIPGFASGGGHRVRGPGTGTSDSILARLSAGEYVNTDESRRYWGTDFFDSLNRKMLPTSFMNMLGAAAGSGGNSGPVTNVAVSLINPLTRDPLKQMREESENIAQGIWG